MKEVRVRFAPSPTGGLHLGGVRTALFSYLFARKNKGAFVLRIEDTDQSRFVPGAEEYIIKCLEWCGIETDESPDKGGGYGPYRQSERKDLYKIYAHRLVEEGHAYFAFDTIEEIENMRESYRDDQNPSPQYDVHTRMKMKNSLTLSPDEVKRWIAEGKPYVIRIKIPQGEKIEFRDMIRGVISNESNLLDDKVLLKADGMPTYHLAVVVDDYLMKISHVFRGEEWLPSAPVHVLLWKYLGWEKDMPEWLHLPLILKPDGRGKLSKRDGERLGFPVFPLSWQDHEGYKEKGFLPEAFVNMLALLGWNDGTDKELFSMVELIEAFDVTRIHKAGAKFNYEKALWFNQHWLKEKSAAELLPLVNDFLPDAYSAVSSAYLEKCIQVVKDRCTLLGDFEKEISYLIHAPKRINAEAIKGKWKSSSAEFYSTWIEQVGDDWHKESLERTFKLLANEKEVKLGEVMMPLRIMLVGDKHGIGVFDIAEMIGRDETICRIHSGINQIDHA